MATANWVFTYNNPEDWITWKPKYMQYLHQQPQMSASGTPHLQGFVQFKKNYKMAGVKTHLGKDVHVQIARGTLAQVLAYVTTHDHAIKTNRGPAKIDGVPVEYEPPRREQGKRKDIDALVTAVNEGKTTDELIEMMPGTMARYQKFEATLQEWKERKEFKEIEYPVNCTWFNVQKPEGKDKKRHIWLWGPASMGKSLFIAHAFKGTKMYLAPAEDKYRFEGYRGQEVVWYDDVKDIRVEELIEVSNTYWQQKERVGGSRYVRAYWPMNKTRTIIVSSNHRPNPAWGAPFTTRFHVIEATWTDAAVAKARQLAELTGAEFEGMPEEPEPVFVPPEEEHKVKIEEA